MSKNQIENLYAYIDKNKATNYPIGNAQLADATDYIKNAYVKMLAVILQQGAEITQAQRNLFQRMITGANCDHAMEDYLRQALEIKVEEYLNFAVECKELPMKYRFILDALLLIAVEEKNEDQLKLAANFVESLKISKDEIAYLAQLAKAILSQSACDYADLEENKPISISLITASEYLTDFANSNLICGQRMTIASVLLPGKAVDGNIDLSNTVKTPVIKLANMKISMQQCGLVFRNFEKVILENCEFENGKFSVYMTDCKSIYLSHCSFKDFSARVIVESGVDVVTLTDTCFENCYYEHSRTSNTGWTTYGCVIHSENPGKNMKHSLVRCKFKSCGGKHERSDFFIFASASAFICDCKSDVIGSSFQNCWHYNANSLPDPEDARRTMFAAGSNAVNCTFEDCADFA
ncbi:MAG: right-handed parallel beta-helix repeat-containing protein [Ruthenibacterium sp.]